ncbi:MAG: sulfurtransferase complex subunit TusB [Coprothermobacterota bacterium]|jgi:sulfur relay protein TusB/DsrH|nr:sulfurtransferase complex subunit TusB [Caldisericota bacterium]MDI6869458.1 sulfurtransferase complex subunit TusB [Coprothermobacterota bacterium]
MGYLFIFSVSPFKRNEIELHLKLAREGDSCIFIQNGVVACKGTPQSLKKLVEEKRSQGVSFYFLKEDLEARGIEHVWGNLVDYDGFLDLIERHEKIIH